MEVESLFSGTFELRGRRQFAGRPAKRQYVSVRKVLLLEGKLHHASLVIWPDGTSSVVFCSYLVGIFMGQSWPRWCGSLGRVQEADGSEAEFTTVA